MEIVNNLKNIKDKHRSAVLTIGNFDGVHRGHQSLIAEARQLADKEKAPLLAMTFEPHPRRLFRPDDPPFRLTPAALKAERMSLTGIDCLLSLDFDWDFASQTAGDFVKVILQESIQPRHIIVGNDFCFGQLRKGTPKTIEKAGIPVTVLEKIADEGEAALSSSAIRSALRHGEIEKANRILGWEWEMQGEIVKGDQRGRELGFPTANVHLNETIHPAYGVYATLVQIEGESEWRPAATNIGIRPMFEVPVGQIEAHILDFEGDIYGKTLRVKPIEKIRGEAKFSSLEALIEQIEKDCKKVRKVLGTA